MLVSDLFTTGQSKVYVVTDGSPESMFDWEVEAVDTDLIPADEETYVVKALQVYPLGTCDCFLVISMPERIAETLILKNERGFLDAQSIHELPFQVIPSVAAAGYGSYELYYVKENPQPGIEVLRAGLEKAIDKSSVAGDLGYILRDEERHEEAIEAFLVSVAYEPDSPFTYLELSQLYQAIGMNEQSAYYQQLYLDHGGA